MGWLDNCSVSSMAGGGSVSVSSLTGTWASQSVDGSVDGSVDEATEGVRSGAVMGAAASVGGGMGSA